jgi:2-dehydro-3-deoxygluconokinase
MFDVISIGSCIVELAPTQPGLPLAQAETLQMFPSGSAANFAFAAARLGLKIAFISRVGTDELGQFMINRLSGAGVEVSHVLETPGQYTSTSLCWADGKGKKVFYLYRFPGFSDPLGELTSQDVQDDFLSQGRLLHFSEACVREPKLREVTFQIAARFKALGGRILYCPNFRGVWRTGEADMQTAQRQAVALADLLILNEEEATLIAGQPIAQAGLELREMGPRAVVITSGDKGARLFCDEEEAFVAAHKVPVIYDVGAGDTFQAGFVAGQSWGKDYIESVRIGGAAAALRVSRSGDPANLPTAQEVAELLFEKS